MNVAFRVDASIQIGTGHLMRCMALADELRRDGARTHFVCRALPSHLEKILRESGHTISRLADVSREADEAFPLAHAAWLCAAQAQDAAETLATLAGGVWDWLVVDHYGLDARWERSLRAIATRILCIDDLANRDHDCDALLDQNIQPFHNRYQNRVSANCALMLGTRYVQLRPQFAALRAHAASKPPQARLHIFMGGTDPQGGTVLALKALRYLPAIDTDVVLGRDSPCLPQVKALCRDLPAVTLHIQISDMARLLARATLALGAGGSASWERCCLGIPTLVMSFAENQRLGCRALAAARAAINLGYLDELEAAGVARLLSRVQARHGLLAQMGRRAAALVDGEGAGRVASHMRAAA